MTDLEINKMAQELAKEYDLEYEFCQLYLEDFTNIFQNVFHFTRKDIESYVNRLFSLRNEEAIEYFDRIFQQYCALQASNKDLTEKEAYDRRNFARTIIKKAYEYLVEDGEQLKDVFFEALKQAEQFGIDPYKISNKSTFRRLSDERLTEILNTLLENVYVDTNIEKEFHLFENMEDFKQLFEDCSSQIVQINHKKVQDILQVLSDFTFNKDTKTFYGNVDYIKMIRRSKSLLTQNVDTLKKTIDFLEENFVDKNDPSTKIALCKRVEENPSILLLSPEKVTQVKQELIKHGVDIETANKFCLNIDNLIEIDSITAKELENVGEVKNVLTFFFGEENARKALTKVEYIKTNPLVLKVLLQRATQEGLLEKLLKSPSALNNTFSNFSSTGNPGSDGGNSRTRREKQRGQEENFAAVPNALLNQYDYTSALSRLPETDKKYIEEVLSKLKGERKVAEKDPDEPKIPRGNSGGHGVGRPKKPLSLPQALAEQLANVDVSNMPLVYKIIKKFELAIDFKKKKPGYAEKKFHLDQVRKNCELALDIDVASEKMVEDKKLIKCFETVLQHIQYIADPANLDKLMDKIYNVKNSKSVTSVLLPKYFIDAHDYVKKVFDKYTKITQNHMKLTEDNESLFTDGRGFTLEQPWFAEVNILSYIFAIVGKEASKLYGDKIDLILKDDYPLFRKMQFSANPMLAYLLCDKFSRQAEDIMHKLEARVQAKAELVEAAEANMMCDYNTLQYEKIQLSIWYKFLEYLDKSSLAYSAYNWFKQIKGARVKDEEENGEQVKALYFDNEKGYALRYVKPELPQSTLYRLQHPSTVFKDFKILDDNGDSGENKIIRMDNEHVSHDIATSKIFGGGDGEGK